MVANLEYCPAADTTLHDIPLHYTTLQGLLGGQLVPMRLNFRLRHGVLQQYWSLRLAVPAAQMGQAEYRYVLRHVGRANVQAYSTLLYSTLQYRTLRYTTLHYTTPPYTTPHYLGVLETDVRGVLVDVQASRTGRYQHLRRQLRVGS